MPVGNQLRPAYVPEGEQFTMKSFNADLRALPELRLAGKDGKTVEIPPPLDYLLRTAASLLANDAVVTIVPYQGLVNASQAAELLDASRSHIADLMDRGKIPSVVERGKKMLRLDDVLRYRRHEDEVMAKYVNAGSEFNEWFKQRFGDTPMWLLSPQERKEADEKYKELHKGLKPRKL